MRRDSGFTWIELLMVVGVFAILAAMALPAMRDSALRKQVAESFALADVAKSAVQAAWTIAAEMPKDNEEAALPPAEKMVANRVRSVEVRKGAVTLTFGNNASTVLHGKRITFRPAVVPDQAVVPIAWLCHVQPAPAGMEPVGKDETDVPASWLPVDCRASKGAPPK